MSGDVALIDSTGGEVSRLVRTATTLFDTPRFRPAALVGGLAVTIRLATVHRSTIDVDTDSEGEGSRDLALQWRRIFDDWWLKDRPVRREEDVNRRGWGCRRR